ncbi:MAG TPA: hypothetical protein VMH81_08445 [Bryobacteraceae bacterium]|nr:hypothetical protein [Bryobacteraceae bacterium]
MLHKWGSALWRRAGSASDSESGRLYEQADKRFVQALAIEPNNGEIHAERVEMLRRRAMLYPDEKGRRLLREVCELCEKWTGIYASGPQDARILGVWGPALSNIAAYEAGAERERLYEEADDKLQRAYALSANADFFVNRADILLCRSVSRRGVVDRNALTRVCDLCREINPGSHTTASRRIRTRQAPTLCQPACARLLRRNA